eukprot:10042739-Alexandrium_andersonii.AAC.1
MLSLGRASESLGCRLGTAPTSPRIAPPSTSATASGLPHAARRRPPYLRAGFRPQVPGQPRAARHSHD